MSVLVLCGVCLVPCVTVLLIKTLERSVGQQMVMRYGPISSAGLCDDEFELQGPAEDSVSFSYEESVLDETVLI
jgi:hypothetical protein